MILKWYIFCQARGTCCRRTRVRRRNCGRKTQNEKTIKRSSEGSAQDAICARFASPGPPRAQNRHKLRCRRTRILTIFGRNLVNADLRKMLLRPQRTQRKTPKVRTQKHFASSEDPTQSTIQIISFAFCVVGGPFTLFTLLFTIQFDKVCCEKSAVLVEIKV